MRNKAIGLNGREYPFTVTGYMVGDNDVRPRSSYHLRCRKLLRTMFPTLPICEEVALPGSGNLSLDFYIPFLRLGIEVQGEQHFNKVTKFHRSNEAFRAGQRNDANKRRWCELNNIRLAALDYRHNDDDWAAEITECTTAENRQVHE